MTPGLEVGGLAVSLLGDVLRQQSDRRAKLHNRTIARSGFFFCTHCNVTHFPDLFENGNDRVLCHAGDGLATLWNLYPALNICLLSQGSLQSLHCAVLRRRCPGCALHLPICPMRLCETRVGQVLFNIQIIQRHVRKRCPSKSPPPISRPLNPAPSTSL